MRIKKVSFSRGTTGFFFDDQRAIKAGAARDGFEYKGKPFTEGFKRVRVAGESVSVMLLLEDGQVAIGDCAAVQYSGAGGRDPLFLAETYIPFLERHIGPRLEGREVGPFKDMAAEFDSLEIEGKRLHTAIRYGLTQALLDARAKSRGLLMAEVICEEYGLPVSPTRVPVFGQSGDNRYENVDKMILKNVDVLPHGLINNVDEKLGRDGGKLREYIRWLAARCRELAPVEGYRPRLHLDVYGTIGQIFADDPVRVASYMASLEKEAAGHELYIEGPVDVEHRERQIECLAGVTRELKRLGSRVKVVADEWCNTYEDVVDFQKAGACHMVQIKTPDLGGIQNIVESVLYCQRTGMEAYQGGTCNETDVSARACVHLAMATKPAQILAKPGMGFDEGFMIVKNEMERIAAVIESRRA